MSCTHAEWLSHDARRSQDEPHTPRGGRGGGSGRKSLSAEKAHGGDGEAGGSRGGQETAAAAGAAGGAAASGAGASNGAPQQQGPAAYGWEVRKGSGQPHAAGMAPLAAALAALRMPATDTPTVSPSTAAADAGAAKAPDDVSRVQSQEAQAHAFAPASPRQ